MSVNTFEYNSENHEQAAVESADNVNEIAPAQFPKSVRKMFEHVQSKYGEVAVEIFQRQAEVEVLHQTEQGEEVQGTMVVDIVLRHDIEQLFAYALKKNFAIESCKTIDAFSYSDTESMEANNSSGFNYRVIAGTNRLSLHSFGFAIDLNPKENPVLAYSQPITPQYETPLAPKQVLHDQHPLVEYLAGRLNPETKQREGGLGWVWGGDWSDEFRDMHHFEKVLPTQAYLHSLYTDYKNNAVSETYVRAKLTLLEKNATTADLKNNLTEFIAKLEL